MNVHNCRKCGKMFNYLSGPMMCPACREALENKFKEVKDYIREHQSCGVHEVARECDVEVAQIQQWLREERLQFSAESMVQLECESCGEPIRSGRFCEKCKTNMANGFQDAIKPKEAPVQPKKDTRESPRMRFLS